MGLGWQGRLWCNLPAEPLPELRVPLGGEAALCDLLCLSECRAHLLARQPHPQEAQVGGQAIGEVPRWAPRPTPLVLTLLHYSWSL